jgi:His/Glu/Gln/Arg/opine family amino acid ABC transporter permease subunit
VSFLAIAAQVFSGVGATLTIFCSTLVLSMPLGLLVALGRMNSWAPFQFIQEGAGGAKGFLRGLKPVQLIIKFFISILRGTPLMLQLIVWFYGPYYIFGLRLSAAWRVGATIVGFSINYSAYFAEIFRSGIQSIPQGQREAARVLGYNKVQTFCKIIFPQMCKRVLPPVTNEIITLVKDTSLAFVLAYTEMFTIAKQVAAAQTTIAPLFVAGVFYYVFNLLVAGVMGKVEQHLEYYQ